MTPIMNASYPSIIPNPGMGQQIYLDQVFDHNMNVSELLAKKEINFHLDLFQYPKNNYNQFFP